MTARVLTIAEISNVTPEPEDDEELRRRIAEHLGITLASYARAAHHEMPLLVQRGTSESWSIIRSRVFARDRGVCLVCGLPILSDDWECGHIIDRCVGGTDRDANLVAMHTMCNRIKPLHETRDAYFAWVSTWYEERERGLRAMLSELHTRYPISPGKGPM